MTHHCHFHSIALICVVSILLTSNPYCFSLSLFTCISLFHWLYSHIVSPPLLSFWQSVFWDDVGVLKERAGSPTVWMNRSWWKEESLTEATETCLDSCPHTYTHLLKDTNTTVCIQGQSMGVNSSAGSVVRINSEYSRKINPATMADFFP